MGQTESSPDSKEKRGGMEHRSHQKKQMRRRRHSLATTSVDPDVVVDLSNPPSMRHRRRDFEEEKEEINAHKNVSYVDEEEEEPSMHLDELDQDARKVQNVNKALGYNNSVRHKDPEMNRLQEAENTDESNRRKRRSSTATNTRAAGEKEIGKTKTKNDNKNSGKSKSATKSRNRGRRRASMDSGTSGVLNSLEEIEHFLKTLQRQDPETTQKIILESLQRQAGMSYGEAKEFAAGMQDLSLQEGTIKKKKKNNNRKAMKDDSNQSSSGGDTRGMSDSKSRIHASTRRRGSIQNTNSSHSTFWRGHESLNGSFNFQSSLPPLLEGESHHERKGRGHRKQPRRASAIGNYSHDKKHNDVPPPLEPFPEEQKRKFFGGFKRFSMDTSMTNNNKSKNRRGPMNNSSSKNRNNHTRRSSMNNSSSNKHYDHTRRGSISNSSSSSNNNNNNNSTSEGRHPFMDSSSNLSISDYAKDIKKRSRQRRRASMENSSSNNTSSTDNRRRISRSSNDHRRRSTKGARRTSMDISAPAVTTTYSSSPSVSTHAEAAPKRKTSRRASLSSWMGFSQKK